jgi:hypothetical protein
LQKKNLSLGGFDPPPLARIRPEMLPLHYNDSVVCAPPSHISVIVFTMSKLIQMIFYQVNQWCPLASNGFIIITINYLNDFLPNGIYFHFSDMCPLSLLQGFSFAHIRHRLHCVA